MCSRRPRAFLEQCEVLVVSHSKHPVRESALRVPCHLFNRSRASPTASCGGRTCGFGTPPRTVVCVDQGMLAQLYFNGLGVALRISVHLRATCVAGLKRKRVAGLPARRAHKPLVVFPTA
jgi:hypothetical protein